jgi:LemA protein
MVYNTAREKFPNMLIANSFNFREATLFELAKVQEREPVKVTFGA